MRGAGGEFTATDNPKGLLSLERRLIEGEVSRAGFDAVLRHERPEKEKYGTGLRAYLLLILLS
jgi:hypothetical protein